MAKNTTVKDEYGTTASTIFSGTTSGNGSPVSSNADAIGEMYDKLTDAAKKNIDASVTQGVSQYEADLEKALPEYQRQRQKSAVDTLQNEKAIKEYAYYTGDRGGMSRQDVLQNVTAGQALIGEIDRAEQTLKSDTQRAITDLITQGDIQKALAEAEQGAAKIQSLIQDKQAVEQSQAQWTMWLSEMSGYLPGGGRTLTGQQFDLDKLYTEAQIASMKADTYGTQLYNDATYGTSMYAPDGTESADGTSGTSGKTTPYSDAPFASEVGPYMLSNNAKGLLKQLERNYSALDKSESQLQEDAFKSIQYYVDYLSDTDVDYLLDHFGLSV